MTIKYLREMSDLHLEFGNFIIPPLATDKETILLLCGDIHTETRIVSNDWLKAVSEQFAHVVYILGNHEHYGSSIDLTGQRVKESIEALKLSNVTFLQNEMFEIPGHNIKIFGGTMWTDFNKSNPITMHCIENTLSDYEVIRKHNFERELRANDILLAHMEYTHILDAELFALRESGFDGYVIVMSHHAPHQLSTHPRYLNAIKEYHLNGAYSSDLSNLILDYPMIKYWFHGHMHNNSDYMIGDCRIICNPRGYHGEEINKHFNPAFVLEL